jgi:hypothetical protein
LSRAWGEDSDTEDDIEDTDSFRATARKKRETSLEFVQDTDSGKSLGVALVACLPLDQLSYRLQHLDHCGGGVAELVDPGEGGLLLATQRKFWEYMNAWHEEGSAFLKTIWHLLENEDSVINESRLRCLSLSAALWSRCELRLHITSSKPQLPLASQTDTALANCCIGLACSRNINIS